MAKQIALGNKVRARAGRDKAFGRRLDKMAHGSPARQKAAGGRSQAVSKKNKTSGPKKMKKVLY